MAEILSAAEFLKKSRGKLLIDVRSEKEYKQGHISGAVNIPLLNNESRAVVGTTYKQEGREAAVLKGFELVGGEFHEKIKEVISLSRDKEVFVYCWRGGMRSNIFAWLLSLAGFKVSLLKAGYKSFRNRALDILKESRNVVILGGYTGSGKTELLHAVSSLGECTIDLEALARHKGSAFGALGQEPQPSNEQFENDLAIQWESSAGKLVWIENESRMIGGVKIPDSVFEFMRNAPVIAIELSIEERMERIIAEYAKFSKEELQEATLRIKKRLGDLRWRQAKEMLEEGKLREWVMMMLEYYDKFYAYGNQQREQKKIHAISFNGEALSEKALRTIELSHKLIYESAK